CPVRQVVCLLFVCALLTANGLVPESWAAQQAVSPAAKSAVAAVVNLNTATAEQLAKLPGVGAKTAARIIDYRQKNGGFKKIEELMNVRGIGEKIFLRMKSQLSVAPPTAQQ
ncbi:MAG: helix-hairpin-helix domain-containing protein, partial [Acidobacteriota bacterium]